MISFINNALKHRESEKGFSLVELIVVVAILGILVVIAIPVFGAIQTTARQNTIATAAASAATSIAASVTIGEFGAAAETVERLNAIDDEFAYTLATAANHRGGQVLMSIPMGSAVYRSTGGPIADNESTDSVYVYAADDRNQWAGAGSGGPATSSWD